MQSRGYRSEGEKARRVEGNTEYRKKRENAVTGLHW